MARRSPSSTPSACRPSWTRIMDSTSGLRKFTNSARICFSTALSSTPWAPSSTWLSIATEPSGKYWWRATNSPNGRIATGSRGRYSAAFHRLAPPQPPMLTYHHLYQWLSARPEFQPWLEILPRQIAQGLSVERWGDRPDWDAALARLPALTPTTTDFQSQVRIGEAGDRDDIIRNQLRDTLMALHPWRKGPWQLFGL